VHCSSRRVGAPGPTPSAQATLKNGKPLTSKVLSLVRLCIPLPAARTHSSTQPFTTPATDVRSLLCLKHLQLMLLTACSCTQHVYACACSDDAPVSRHVEREAVLS
jgi:hypothetical protein